MIPRPVPKDRLKKMFLQMLLEIEQPGNKYASQGHGTDAILNSILPHRFELENTDPNLLYTKWALTKQEMRDAKLGIQDLEHSRHICDDPEHGGGNWKILTDKGRAAAEKA